MPRKKILGIMFFYSFTYLIVYIVNPFLLLHFKMQYNLFNLLLIHILTLIGMSLIVLVILKLNNENCVLSTLGIKKHGLGNSFLWAAAFSTPIPLFWLIGSQIAGIDAILIAAKPFWANPPISSQTLIFATILWIMTGIVAFIFWEAFPYEFMRNFSKKFVIPLIAVFWVGLYNAPFLTGKFDPFDIIFFGFLFTFVYHRTKNSVGILMVYLLNENPLWWVIAATFGSNIKIMFMVFLILRMLICSISAFWVIKTRILKKR